MATKLLCGCGFIHLGPFCLHVRFAVKELAYQFADVRVAILCQFLELPLFGFANSHVEAGGTLLAHCASSRLLGVCCAHIGTVPVSSHWRQAKNETIFRAVENSPEGAPAWIPSGSE